LLTLDMYQLKIFSTCLFTILKSTPNVLLISLGHEESWIDVLELSSLYSMTSHSVSSGTH